MVLGKIKNLLSHDEVIVELQNKIKESVDKITTLTQTVSNQQDEQEKLLEQVKSMTKEHKKFSKQIIEAQEQIEIANKKLGRAVSEILILKPKLEKELVGKFEKTLQEHLNTATKELKIEVEEHKKAQDILSKTQVEQEKLLKELTKLSQITSNLKAEDFELSKHAKELHLKDQEKLRLMKRVDDLEKMLAKMKRR